MSVLKIYGTVKADVELKSSAKEFFQIWRSDSHKLPNITSSHIQKVKLHEGDWDAHGAIKIWNYTVQGKSGTMKEKVDFDDANLKFTLHGIEGDVFEEYKVYKPICKLTPKERGCVAHLEIEYEKQNASVPTPDKYMDFFISMTKDIDANHVSLS